MRNRNRFITAPATPMAAKALSPTNRPTITASTVLYSCCRILPASSGADRAISCRLMGP